MKHLLRTLAAASMLCFIWSASAAAEGDAIRGKQFFNRCAACHSIDGTNKSGPSLNGVFGRKAGVVVGYRYSKAITDSNVVWDDATLETYLSGPTKMLRGTRMTTSVVRPDDRANIIAYLKTLVAQ